ncbi:MAG: hypothetical protein COT74_07560 [Bdellovibrionales bacterium CG10_big_fil_rev_8_21_14_0_10_45_34]|nr:MAG: hypothetical protein COT74_07560 [Bdellovibrionales bacterium CG10_big_fil_rev_8_21_14_0_10_45_34]
MIRLGLILRPILLVFSVSLAGLPMRSFGTENQCDLFVPSVPPSLFLQNAISSWCRLDENVHLASRRWQMLVLNRSWRHLVLKAESEGITEDELVLLVAQELKQIDQDQDRAKRSRVAQENSMRESRLREQKDAIRSPLEGRNEKIINVIVRALGKAEDAITFEDLETIKVLNLGSLGLKVLGKEDLRGLTGLETLYLEYNDMVFIERLAFKDLKRLKILNLTGNRGLFLAQEVFYELVSLGELYLGEIGLSHLSENQFRFNSKLYKLNLSNNAFQRLNPKTFAPLTELLGFYISQNHLRAFQSETLQNNPRLKALNLSNNHLQAFDRSLFKVHPHLEKLNVARNALPSDDLVFLQGISETIETLY